MARWGFEIRKTGHSEVFTIKLGEFSVSPLLDGICMGGTLRRYPREVKFQNSENVVLFLDSKY
jgi:hypothetical protein